MQKYSVLMLLILSSFCFLTPILGQSTSWVTSQQMFDSTQVLVDRTNGGLIVFGELYHRNEVGTPGSSVHSFDQSGNLRWRIDFPFSFNFEYAGLNVIPAGPDQWLMIYHEGICLNEPENVFNPQFELIDRITGERTELPTSSQEAMITAFAVDESVEYIYLATETEILRREIMGEEFESYFDYTFDLVDPVAEENGLILSYMLPNNIILLVRDGLHRRINLETLIEIDIIQGSNVIDVYLGTENFYIHRGSVITYTGYDEDSDPNFVLEFFEENSRFVNIDQEGLALLFNDGTYQRYNTSGTELLGQGTIDLDLGQTVRASYQNQQFLLVSDVGVAESATEHFAGLYSTPLDSDAAEFVIERESDINLIVEDIILDSLVDINFSTILTPRAYLTASVRNESNVILENLTIIEADRDWEAGCVPLGSGLPYRRYYYLDGLSIAPGATEDVSFFVEDVEIDDEDFEFDLSFSFNFPNQRLEESLSDNVITISISNLKKFIDEASWSLSPNPVFSGQNLHLETEAATPSYWSIISTNGQLLRQGTTTGPTSSIDHGLTTPGIYFLRIQGDSGVGTKRFVLH